MIKTKTSLGKEQETIYKLYNGEIELRFKPYGHRYEIDGVEVLGVTTILKTVIAKEAITAWAVKLAGQYVMENIQPDVPYTREEIENIVTEAKRQHVNARQQAADTGTKVHEIIEQYIKAKIAGNTYEVSGEDMKTHGIALQSFFKWEAENEVKWEVSEKVVYSRKYNYAGTLDIIGTVRGIRTLIDLKTSNAIYPESYFLQVAAYKYAYDEEYPDNKLANMMIVRIPKTKDDTIEVMPVPDYEDNARAFIHGLGLYSQVSKLKNIYKIKK